MEFIEDQDKRIAYLQQEVTKREENKKMACSVLKMGLTLGLCSLCLLFPKVIYSGAEQNTTVEEIQYEQKVDDMFYSGLAGVAIATATVAISGKVASKEDEKLSKARRDLQFEYE